ncbi:MAG: hypothetical protein HY594_02870 [Candidatus Omnitrophica bacterium]|nr:hypothetical protein [Candidatus Omnitrophota bacterium]
MRYFRSSGLKISRKPDGSPVTQADRAIEERLRRAIRKDFPGEIIVGEEFGGSTPDQGTYWTIDPIDGTRAFSRGLPSWGIMIGRVERGVPALGVVDFPAIHVRIAVAPGVKPFERMGRKIRQFKKIPPPPRIQDAVIFHGGIRWWKNTPYQTGFQKLLVDCYLERAYGDCYAFLWAFRGNADTVVEYGVKVWDLVPLAAIARRLGWAFTDFLGRAQFTGPELLMAHPKFIPTLSQTLKGGD